MIQGKGSRKRLYGEERKIHRRIERAKAKQALIKHWREEREYRD